MGKWKGIVGRSFTIDEFSYYVAGINWEDWRPEFIVLHHTAMPSLSQRPLGLTHEYILGLEKYYRDEMGWSAGPHLFVDDRQIWVFTPLTTPGVHAKSFNRSSIGVEMLGDYDREDFNSGRGMAVQRNAVAAIAILSEALDIDPDSMVCHRDEPSTSKTCPGRKVDKGAFIRAVKDYLAGEPLAASPVSSPESPEAPIIHQGVPAMSYRIKPETLNIRSGPGTNYEDLGDVNAGQIVTPVDITGWIPVLLEDNTIGWLCLEYLEAVGGGRQEEAQPTPAPASLAPESVDFSTREGTIAAIKAECIRQGIGEPEQIAYVLATVEWETARTFEPVREAYWKDEDWRRLNLSRYYPYYGRGYVQLTWKANYQKYAGVTGKDLVNFPDLAMEPETALFILVYGFKTGAFTGKKIADYINDDGHDFYNARRCVNGVDHAEDIAAIAEKYLEAL